MTAPKWWTDEFNERLRQLGDDPKVKLAKKLSEINGLTLRSQKTRVTRLSSYGKRGYASGNSLADVNEAFVSLGVPAIFAHVYFASGPEQASAYTVAQRYQHETVELGRSLGVQSMTKMSRPNASARRA